jgi:hypothetical protein
VQRRACNPLRCNPKSHVYPLNFVNNFSGVSTELIDELQDALKGLPIDQKVRAEFDQGR